jgi:hypothetical protein
MSLHTYHLQILVDWLHINGACFSVFAARLAAQYPYHAAAWYVHEDGSAFYVSADLKV